MVRIEGEKALLRLTSGSAIPFGQTLCNTYIPHLPSPTSIIFLSKNVFNVQPPTITPRSPALDRFSSPHPPPPFLFFSHIHTHHLFRPFAHTCVLYLAPNPHLPSTVFAPRGFVSKKERGGKNKTAWPPLHHQKKCQPHTHVRNATILVGEHVHTRMQRSGFLLKKEPGERAEGGS